ncbi:MAG: RNA polymerase factor sigma-54 [Planctomycetota bacterium]|nr:RNA polymerase factor sigma-54 [Planctomycetota bacterium]
MRMELGLSQQQTLKQIQTLSPQMYMSMEILCLNSLDLEQRIGSELENNETLERAEPEEEKPAAEVEGEPAPQAAKEETWEDSSGASGSDESIDARFERWDQFAREEYALTPGPRRFRGERDEKYEALSNTAGRPISLQENLEQQIHLLGDDEIRTLSVRRALEARPAEARSAEAAGGAALSQGIGGNGKRGEAEERDADEIEKIRDGATEIIYNIDSRGYLMYDLDEIQASLVEPTELHVLEAALAVVQSLDPPGVGGRNLKECLLLQLKRDIQDYPLEERIIGDHLDDLGHNRLPKIARALAASIDDIKEAADNIASLNPLPGKLFGGGMPHYVKPDVVVEDVEERYEVRVESDYLPRLRISPHYRTLFKESRKNPEVKKYLKKKIDSAEWLLAAIRQRQSTLQKIAQEVVDIQNGFLDHGISHLRPLKMADVAERVGVHVSTISRAISGKYMQTPRGIYAMKFFFTGGATRADGNVEARGSVIQRIKDLIAQEDKTSPLSDIRIVRKLEESGIKISRRTVTKYREAETIPSSRERRSY